MRMPLPLPEPVPQPEASTRVYGRRSGQIGLGRNLSPWSITESVCRFFFGIFIVSVESLIHRTLSPFSHFELNHARP